MKASDPELLNLMISRSDDFVEFEIASVQTSADFWSGVRPEQA
jgi:hypothetical protein